ncbi:MAG: ABC transporter substrate-binding protein, partial [Desulfotomaculaceae bacterium]
MRKRTLILSLVIIVGLLLGLSLLISNVLLKDKEPIITLTVVENEPSLLHLPLYVALQQGYFEEQGIRVRLTEENGKSGSDQGIPDADVVLIDPAEYLYYKTIRPEAPVIVTIVAGHDGTFLLAREKGDFTWNNLKGKRIISYPPETGPGLALDKKLRDNGLTPFRDTGIYHRIPQDLRLGAFKSGSGDYIQLTGIEALIAEQDGTGFIAAPVDDKDEAFPAVICVVARETINKHPQAVQTYVNGLYKAQLYMVKEPDLSLKAAHKFLSKNER